MVIGIYQVRLMINVVIYLGLFSSLIFGFITFDQIVRVQHANYYQAWIEDGKPDGFFWRPPGRNVFQRMNWSGTLCVLKWLFITPNWVKQEDLSGRHLRQFRICILVWDMGVVLVSLWHPELFRKH